LSLFFLGFDESKYLALDRIEPVNVALRSRGLPEKAAPDPETTDLSVRKCPKPKTGLRYTTDLVIIF
jgi:hypothetical protein